MYNWIWIPVCRMFQAYGWVPRTSHGSSLPCARAALSGVSDMGLTPTQAGVGAWSVCCHEPPPPGSSPPTPPGLPDATVLLDTGQPGLV